MFVLVVVLKTENYACERCIYTCTCVVLCSILVVRDFGSLVQVDSNYCAEYASSGGLNPDGGLEFNGMFKSVIQNARLVL